MTRKRAIEIIEDACEHIKYHLTEKGKAEEFYQELGDIVIAFNLAISALEQEPCETSTDEPMTMVYPTIFCDDAISRKAVIRLIRNENSALKDIFITHSAGEELSRQINELPSVTQKSGKWILKRTFPTKLYDEYLNEYKCSECYREIRCTESQLVNYPYCHCGAKMESEEQTE